MGSREEDEKRSFIPKPASTVPHSALVPFPRIAARATPARTPGWRSMLAASEPGVLQPLVASAASCCSTSSPSIEIWISSLTTNLPSSIMLKLRPKSFRLILVVAP